MVQSRQGRTPRRTFLPRRICSAISFGYPCTDRAVKLSAHHRVAESGRRASRSKCVCVRRPTNTVTPDGQRFLINSYTEEATASPITLILELEAATLRHESRAAPSGRQLQS